MRSQTSSRSDDVSLLYNGQLYACAHEKIPRTFAYSVGLLNFIILSSLVCVLVYLSMHRRCKLGPSNATEKACISAATAPV